MDKKIRRQKYEEAVKVVLRIQETIPTNLKTSLMAEMAEEIARNLATVYGVEIDDPPILKAIWTEGQWEVVSKTNVLRESGRMIITDVDNDVVIWLKDDQFKAAILAYPDVLRAAVEILDIIESEKPVNLDPEFVVNFRDALRKAGVL